MENYTSFDKLEMGISTEERVNLLSSQSEQEMLLRLRDKKEIPFELVADMFGWDMDQLQEKFNREADTVFDPIYKAAKDDLVKTKMLIEAGADPYYCCEPGRNALCEAAIQNHCEIVEFFLFDCGIDPSRSFLITIDRGDTLRLRDILDLIPLNYREVEEYKTSLKRIYQYLDEWEKKHKVD